jgi:hypothetical protein
VVVVASSAAGLSFRRLVGGDLTLERFMVRFFFRGHLGLLVFLVSFASVLIGCKTKNADATGSVSGKVELADGSPLPFGFVQFRTDDGPKAMSPISNGRYFVTGLAPGTEHKVLVLLRPPGGMPMPPGMGMPPGKGMPPEGWMPPGKDMPPGKKDVPPGKDGPSGKDGPPPGKDMPQFPPELEKALEPYGIAEKPLLRFTPQVGEQTFDIVIKAKRPS